MEFSLEFLCWSLLNLKSFQEFTEARKWLYWLVFTCSQRAGPIFHISSTFLNIRGQIPANYDSFCIKKHAEIGQGHLVLNKIEQLGCLVFLVNGFRIFLHKYAGVNVLRILNKNSNYLMEMLWNFGVRFWPSAYNFGTKSI